MRRQDFHFDLPNELIADHPLPDRAASRLLCLNGATGALADRQFADVVDLLQAGDVLVVNDTRVLPARLHGVKQASGGRVEVLVERVLDERHALAHVRANKTPKAGAVLRLEDAVDAEVSGREGELFRLRFDGDAPLVELLERHGHMPLPPYIRREDEDADRERYQTVYAREPGAVAAPTAGLHFTDTVLQALKDKGVQVLAITLHVGAGTFQPVRVDDIRQHTMHAEVFQVSDDVATRINRARDEGRRVIAVGTTVVRALESAAAQGRLAPYSGETRIFITPGYRFQVIDGLITNFHLPESTLIMLVSALAGYRHVMDAYRHAVAERYRFFSYGDAMFIHPAHPEARP